MKNLILGPRAGSIGLRACCWLLCGLAWIATPAWAKEVSWSDVKAKMTGAEGYSLDYTYDGPEGTYRMHCIVQPHNAKILTEVLEGSARGAGSRILYDPGVDKENVTVKTHMLTIRRSLQAKDIKDSSLYQPLFSQLIDGLVSPNPSQIIRAPGGHQVFLFGEKAGTQDRLEVDQNGDPVSMRRLEKSREMKKFSFSALTWGPATITWP